MKSLHHPESNGNGRATNAKSSSERFVRKRVASLKPSPENLSLYDKSPDPEDAEIIKLADSIRRNGCDPLVITLDNFIVSGHRRRMALTLNGQVFVKCRVLPVRRNCMDIDDYTALIRKFNLQRHKSVAEQVREELVDINAEDAHQRLREMRDRSVNAAQHNGVTTLTIEGRSKRYNISDDKADHVKYVKKIIFEDRRDYWPLGIRSVHYPLLNYDFIRGYYWPRRDEPGHGTRLELRYRNDDGSYDATSDLITRLRLSGEIPWEAIDDFTRPFKDYRAFDDVREYVRQEMDNLFAGYWRKLLQSQPNHVEVLVEKNTVYHMAARVTDKYQVPVSSGRGFNSIDPYHDLFERYKASVKKRLLLIVLADWDPEGEMIPQVAGRTLRDDFGIDDSEIIKAGVTREQIRKYQLPPQNFAKESSSNHQWFVERNGGDNTVYELEALDPADMMRDLDNVIKNVLDLDLFNKEAAVEQEEAAYLEALRTKTMEALRGVGE